MHKTFTAAILAATIALPAQAGTITDTFTSFYSFGDSLTDDGKFGALSAPSLDGRFTNGLTWAEYIEDDFIAAGHDTGNLALGGATAGPVNLNPAGPLSTFGGQIATFAGALAAGVGLPTKILPSLETKPNGPAPGSNPLVSVWFGANDIFQGFNPIDAANSVADGIRAIGSIAGHSFDDFLVMSLPDIGQTPAFSGAGSAAATAATDLFNAQLWLNIKTLETEGFNIVGFDSGTVTQAILDDIATGSLQFGILDATNPCTVSLGAALNPNAPAQPSCVDFGIDPNSLLYVDAVHPNAVAHQLMGEAATSALEASLAPVPLPASLPMLLAAFGLAGLIRRRAA